MPDICATPGKARYATHTAAASIAAAIRNRSGDDLHPYACPCGWHHLTSSPRPTADASGSGGLRAQDGSTA